MSLAQGRRLSVGVRVVTPGDRVLAFVTTATTSAFFERRGEEDLHRRVGKDHGRDVASFDDRAEWLGGGELTLTRHHRGAHFGIGRDYRHSDVDVIVAEFVLDVTAVHR